MPKKVDHNGRRVEIANALLRLAARDGLDEVSLRHVAAEAGISSGAVQHYFRTKEQMMAFAMATVQEYMQRRIVTAVSGLGDNPAPRELLRTTLAEMLPIDAPRQLHGKVALAFLAYAAVHPATAARLREETAEVIRFVAGQIATAQSAGYATAQPRPEVLALGLLTVTEGLINYLLGGHCTPAMALEILDSQLATIFT